jgi:hypothetical protein
MNKKVIFVRASDPREIEVMINDLIMNKIYVKRKIAFMYAETKDYIIKFIVIPIKTMKENIRYVLGCRADGCIGFDDDASDYLTRHKNICEGKDLVEFLKSEENENEKIQS